MSPPETNAISAPSGYSVGWASARRAVTAVETCARATDAALAVRDRSSVTEANERSDTRVMIAPERDKATGSAKISDPPVRFACAGTSGCHAGQDIHSDA